MYDITMYGSLELILHVFNDEDMYGKAWELYRDADALCKWAESLFRFDSAQWAAFAAWALTEFDDDGYI